MKQARFTALARAELLAETSYYENGRSGLGVRFRAGVEEASELAASSPKSGAPIAGVARRRLLDSGASVTVLPNATDQGRIFVWISLVVALAMLALAVDSWVHPLPLPAARPLRWIAGAAYELGGRGALSGMWGALGVIAVVAARFVWRHTPKIPTDRWWRR